MFKAICMPALVALVLVVTAFGLGGCGGCNLIPSVPVELSVPIKDPTFAKLAEAGQLLELSASGHLAAGKYNVGPVPLDVAQDTDFKLAFRLPLRGQAVIHAKDATGTFSSSKELVAYGVPVPTQLSFTEGKVSGDVQFVRILCAFLIELVNQQVHTGQKGTQDVAGILTDVSVEKVRLDLKPGGVLDLPGARLAIDQDSSIELTEVKVDKSFNYKARCMAKLNLRAGSELKDEKSGLSIQIGSGALALPMIVASEGGILKLSTQEGGGAGNEIALKPLAMTVKKDTATYVLKCASASVSSLKYSSTKKVGSETSSVNASAKLYLTGTEVSLNRPDLAVAFEVADPVSLAFDLQQDEQGNKFRIDSPGTIVATNIILEANRSDGKISLTVQKATIGCRIASSADQIGITLPKGELNPRQLVWDRGTGKIIVSLPGNSRLMLTRDVHISLNPASRALEGTIPISLKGGTTSITSPAQSLMLEGINGNMTLDLGEKGTSLVGKLNTVISSQPKATGGITTCGVSIGSLRVAPSPGHLSVDLVDCMITIPRSVLEQMISAKIPQKKTFSVNKELLENSRWRYRNLIVRDAQLSNLKLRQFKFGGPNVLLFTGDADVLARGTVESSGFLSFLQQQQNWTAHPWSANAHVGGSGQVQFQFVPGPSVADSAIGFSANMTMAVPDNLNLDWSQVAGSGDMMAHAETGLVRGALKMANFCLPPDALSFKKDGTINLFKNPSRQMRSIKMDRCTAKAVGDNLTVNFSSHMEL